MWAEHVKLTLFPIVSFFSASRVCVCVCAHATCCTRCIPLFIDFWWEMLSLCVVFFIHSAAHVNVALHYVTSSTNVQSVKTCFIAITSKYWSAATSFTSASFLPAYTFTPLSPSFLSSRFSFSTCNRPLLAPTNPLCSILHSSLSRFPIRPVHVFFAPTRESNSNRSCTDELPVHSAQQLCRPRARAFQQAHTHARAKIAPIKIILLAYLSFS